MEVAIDYETKLFPKSKPAVFNEKQEPFFTNFYKVQFKENFKNIYQFSMVVEPQIPLDSHQQIRRITQAGYQQLKKKIQLFAYRGLMIWGFKSLNGQTVSEKIKFKIKQQEYQYNIFVQQTKILNFLDMQAYPKEANKFLQILNIKIQNEVRKLDYVDLGKGVYSLKKELNKHVLEQFGVNVCQGFKFTLTPINKSIYIKIDLHTRIFQTKSVLDIINEELRKKKKTKQEVQKYLQGSIAVTNYGNFNTYKIKSIQYKTTPKEKFQCGGKFITYYQYYLEKYAVKIKCLEQPLLLAESNSKNYKEDIYIVPELVSLAGLPNQQIKQNFKYTQQIARITKIDPETRMSIIEKFLDDISENQEILKIGDYLEAKGHVLEQPEIKVGKNVLKSCEGRISLRDSKLKDAGTFNDWVLIYSISSNPQQDRDLTDQIVSNFKKASRNYGITVQQPGFLEIKGKNVELWKQKMQDDIKKNGKPQIILIVTTPYQEKYYGQFKKWLLLEKSIPSQMICKKKMLKKGLTIISNILLQMNVKIGKPIWQIQRKHSFFQKQDVVSAGISISQNLNRKGCTLALVGSLNSKSNEFTSAYESKLPDKSDIVLENFISVFNEWLSNYYMKSKKLPNSIIIYRQGLTDPQITKQIPKQILALKKSYSAIWRNEKNQFKQPKVIYVIVSKTIDTRFFTFSKDLLKNPKSGSIIPQQPNDKNKYSFYLVPHHVHEGTCTPTNFTIAYDDSQIPADALMRFTFEQCFNYFNWQGAVTVPAVLQYAEKLSGFVAKHIGQNLKSKALCNSLFYI